ncbi:hypothetical protein P4V86_15575 [Brevibacillus laterosporus]|uniref:SprT-like domain-containing protein n=1 Tax=Brevibacillus laterosporus TaxID=1465 RepID=UPI000363BEE7|nr:SprT-like domain-containing protein [Brevibacillus laterosporus]ATO50976.1 hypothetical protein BrL25_18880 [Brevibacillus laterosporus DSM 25]MED2004766.1 hypothetical protein [Brevibacillus laterosporus]
MDGNLTLCELYEVANEMCRKHWGVDYTGIIELKRRNWRRRLACFSTRRNEPEYAAIRFCSVVNAQQTRDEVIDTLLHELVHWRLWSLGLPHRDVDPEFVRECIRVGTSFSQTTAAQRAVKLYGGAR